MSKEDHLFVIYGNYVGLVNKLLAETLGRSSSASNITFGDVCTFEFNILTDSLYSQNYDVIKVAWITK